MCATASNFSVVVPMSSAPQRPPLTRVAKRFGYTIAGGNCSINYVSVKLTGGEKKQRRATHFSPSAPLGHLPRQREAGALPRRCNSPTNSNLSSAPKNTQPENPAGCYLCYLMFTINASASPLDAGRVIFTFKGLSSFSETWLGSSKTLPSLNASPRISSVLLKPSLASKV